MAFAGTAAETTETESTSHIQKPKNNKCSFQLVLAHDNDRIHVTTIAMDLDLSIFKGKAAYRILYTRQVHHPGEKWWAPTPRNIKTIAAFNHHPGCSGENLAHGPNIPHVKKLRFLYTVTTGSNSHLSPELFVPRLQRERFILDLEDDVQHAVAVHLFSRTEAHRCHQEWVVEASIDEEQLPPLICSDLYSGMGAKHLPMQGTLTLIYVYLITEPIIQDSEVSLLVAEIQAQDRDLDRLALLRASDSKGLSIEHVAAIMQPYIHIKNTLASLKHLENMICVEFVVSLIQMLKGLDSVFVQGISRYIRMLASNWREVEVVEKVKKVDGQNEKETKNDEGERTVSVWRKMV